MKEVMQITCGWGSTCIRKVVSEEFRVTKGGKREVKETW
jgi:hypothetical protein